MTLKEFMEVENIYSFELVDNILINVIVDNTPYGLDTDTSSIQAGTLLNYINEYNISGDILYIDGIEYDMTTISLVQ